MTAPRRLAAAFAVSAGVIALATTAASAQDPSPLPDAGPALNNPGPACAEATDQDVGCDTEYTPIAKDPAEDTWTHIGGARFDQDGELVGGSPTPYTVDFYTVRFQTPELGYAGGAACPDDTPFDQLDQCERVPVIYRYLDPDGAAGELPGFWEEYYHGTTRGYVASIAFTSPAGTEAIAVGGTGSYPRRELGRCEAGETPQTDPDYCHGDEPPTGETDEGYAARDLAGEEPNAAGTARVWIHRSDRWRELTEEEERETAEGDPMRGLTAVDCSPRLPDGKRCLAGGYRQLWLWQGDQFTKAFTDRSRSRADDPDNFEVDYPDRFRFRVRAIRFAPGGQVFGAQAIAVTAGCCADRRTIDQPWAINFDGESLRMGITRQDLSFLTLNQAHLEHEAVEDEEPNKRLADSLYSISWGTGNFATTASVITAPGGPPPRPAAEGLAPPPEAPSRIGASSKFLCSAGNCPGSTSEEVLRGNGAVQDPGLSALRLVAGDGDFGSPPGSPGSPYLEPDTTIPDGLVDWTVGQLASSGQGIAYTTLYSPTPLSDAVHCPPGLANLFATDGSQVVALSQCELKDSNGVVTGTKSKRLVGLPTYALNAFSYIPDSGNAWAAGDKGALLSLGGKQAAGGPGAEPQPPRLGARQPGELGERSAYDSFSADRQGPVGAVPPLASRPEVRLPEPRLVASGLPYPTQPDDGPREDVNEIVMSRDGSEGWAIGNESFQNAGTTLFHYTGGRWTRCETDSVPGVIEPDPACEALAPLREPGQGKKPIAIAAAVRLPLERDGDPSNDDEFELLAIGGEQTDPRLVLRYRDGRWSVDAAATEQFSLDPVRWPEEMVAVSPDDVWLLTHWTSSSDPQLYHYDGEGWSDCEAKPLDCGDPAGLLPTGNVARIGTIVEAGGRVFFGGTRVDTGGADYPFVLYKDPGPEESWSRDPAQGGVDQGCIEMPSPGRCVGSGEPSDQGTLLGLTVVRAAGGGYEGWASGAFGGGLPQQQRTSIGDQGRKAIDAQTPLLRLQPTDGGGANWGPWPEGELSLEQPLADRGDAANDYLSGSSPPREMLSIPGPDGEPSSWIIPRERRGGRSPWRPLGPILRFNEQGWGLAPVPFAASDVVRDQSLAVPEAAGPDNRGSFWLAASQAGISLDTYGLRVAFLHYTDRVPEPVFEEAPHPVREKITAAAGGADGSFWVATASSTLYRHDPDVGWERVRVPGWDPGRTVTRPSQATAIAIGVDGEGLVVGEGGRIAELTPAGARLDAAAGAVLCSTASSGACGTGHTLRAAAIEPDGAALVGGDARSLLWRSAEGEFHAIPPPPTAPNARITGIAYSDVNTAYLTTDLGQVFVGDPSSANPGWRVENRDLESGLLESVDGSGQPLELRAIAVDSQGHGLAVGERGLVLERDGDPAEPWRRVEPGLRDELYSVALPATGGRDGLIGGAFGVIYTVSDGKLQVAREADPWNPLTAAKVTDSGSGRIVGLGMLPGAEPGGVEAWAASQIFSGFTPEKQAILRYSSASGDGAEPLPDAPAPSEGEISLAAFGRTDCPESVSPSLCPALEESETTGDATVRRVSEEIVARAGDSRGPFLAAFTGDAAVYAGRDGASATPGEVDIMHRRWAEIVGSRFGEERVPLFGALGSGDLGPVRSCFAACLGTGQAQAGTSIPWRGAMAGMPAPWGRAGPLAEDGISYVPVEAPGLGEAPLTGGARTHYALDLAKGDQKLLRLVFADNSLRSLHTSEPNQNPVEQSGQAQWLEQVLCRAGEGSGCTREADEPAVVVANTPTYSYGPGGLEHTATDAATFEQTLLKHRVSALISGRLGWNGLYYTCAPQLHTPQPGGDYPTEAPAGVADCAGQEDANDLPVEPPDPNQLLGDLGGTGILPSVIAASASGRFGPNRDGLGTAADGYWHGYSVVRVPADGNPSQVVVEQRPVFDWISIRPGPGAGATHVVRAGKKLALEGFGREVAGTDAPLRYDEITTAAITHRYDLLVADEDQPWLPSKADGASAAEQASAEPANGGENACAPYLCLASRFGGIDGISGVVKAGKGNYPRTYAVAAVSVGDQAATYPLVFEPRASYQSPTQAPAAPVAVPPPPPPPAPAQPTTPQVNLPAAPVLPVLTAQALAPPPLPPSPPTFASQAPLDLNLTPAALDVTPPTAVSQPPTPPVNPAPPSGARREARQRQAAAQKSGADSAEESGGDAQSGDLAKAPDSHDAAMTRRDTSRTDHSFTAVRHEEPSASARGLLYGGGLTLAALALAFGFSTLRPTPRHRSPELPAPAFSRVQGRGRRR